MFFMLPLKPILQVPQEKSAHCRHTLSLQRAVHSVHLSGTATAEERVTMAQRWQQTSLLREEKALWHKAGQALKASSVWEGLGRRQLNGGRHILPHLW